MRLPSPACCSPPKRWWPSWWKRRRAPAPAAAAWAACNKGWTCERNRSFAGFWRIPTPDRVLGFFCRLRIGHDIQPAPCMGFARIASRFLQSAEWPDGRLVRNGQDRLPPAEFERLRVVYGGKGLGGGETQCRANLWALLPRAPVYRGHVECCHTKQNSNEAVTI